MHDDDTISTGYFLAMPLYFFGQGHPLSDFVKRKNRVKSLSIQVMKDNLMPILFQFGNGCLCNCMIEAFGAGMSQYYRDLHYLKLPVLNVTWFHGMSG